MPSVRHGLGKGGNLLREFVEPFHELRMRLAPVGSEAKIEIAERAGKRDVADVELRPEGGRRLFQLGERAAHLAGLMIDPFRLVFLCRPEAAFVYAQDSRVQ